MKTFMKTVAFGLAVTLAASVAHARDVSFLTRPNGESLPLFVLKAKASDFLPEGTNVILHAAPRTKEAVIKALKNKEVDFATVFHAMGAALHSNGMSHLKLAGVHGWGGVAILSKTSITPGDWNALKGSVGLITPGVKTPSHKVAMAAMMVNGLNPKADLMFAGTSIHNAFDQMQTTDNAPDFVVMPEPQLSHGLLRMQKQSWATQYHVFADAVQSVTDFGMPLGSLWVVGDQEDTAAIVAGFDKAVDYMMDPANRVEVAAILSQGFKDSFEKNAPPKVFENMLERGMLRLNYKSAAAIEAKLRMVWAQAGLSPDRNMIWHGNDFKVPGQAFLVSHMLPRHVGMALAYADELKLTPKTRLATIRIRQWAHKPMYQQLQKARQTEAEIAAAYQKGDWDAIDAGLEKMAAIRLESSRIQVQCIKRTQEEFDPADVEKIRKFMADNTDIVAAFGGM